MTEAEYMEISRRINSRIYHHTHAVGSNGTHAVNKAKADECLQILKIIENVMLNGGKKRMILENFNRMKREMFCESDDVLGNNMLELESAYDYMEQAYVIGVFAMRDKILKEYPLCENDFGMVINESFRNNIKQYASELTDGLEIKE